MRSYHVGEPNTKGDEQLVRSNDSSTNLLGNTLGLVHGNGGGESANSQSGDQSTNGKLCPNSFTGDLDDNTNNVEESRCGDGVSTADGKVSPIAVGGDEQNSYPMVSAIGAEPKQPIKVPILRRPTIVPSLAALNPPFSPKRSMKSDICTKP